MDGVAGATTDGTGSAPPGAPRQAALMRVAAYTDDPELTDTLGRLADGDLVPWIDTVPGGLDAALGELDPRCDVVLVDVGDVPESAALAGVRTLAARPDLTVVPIGRENDIRIYRAMLAAGARDYLVAPFDDRTLADALTPRQTGHIVAEDMDAPPSGRLNLVIGARGGVGASTVAVDAAWWAAERLGTQTGLVDLDPQFGTCALALDLMPGRGLRDALESPDRIDGLFVGSAMMNASDNLYVLAAEESPGEPLRAAPDGLGRLLAALGQSFACLVADLPRHMVSTDPGLLARADTVTLVADSTLAGLRDALRLKQLVEGQAEAPSVALALRRPVSGKGGVGRAEFARGYGADPDWMLPALPVQAAEAAGRGVSLVSRLRRGHPYAKAIAGLAGRCVAPAETATPAKRKRIWPW